MIKQTLRFNLPQFLDWIFLQWIFQDRNFRTKDMSAHVIIVQITYIISCLNLKRERDSNSLIFWIDSIRFTNSKYSNVKCYTSSALFSILGDKRSIQPKKEMKLDSITLLRAVRWNYHPCYSPGVLVRSHIFQLLLIARFREGSGIPGLEQLAYWN